MRVCDDRIPYMVSQSMMSYISKRKAYDALYSLLSKSENFFLRRKPCILYSGSHIIIFRIVSSLNHIDLPLFMINKVNGTLLRQFLGLYCRSKLIIRLTPDVFLISILYTIFSSLNQFHLPLFMINKVNDALLRQFLCLYCFSKLIIRLTHDDFLISLLFRIVSSLNQFHLPLFMINKVNVTLLRQFLNLYCLSKHIVMLAHGIC